MTQPRGIFIHMEKDELNALIQNENIGSKLHPEGQNLIDDQ